MRKTFRKRTFLAFMVYLLIAVAILAMIAAYFVPFKLRLFSEKREVSVGVVASSQGDMCVPSAHLAEFV
jgi:hypothetical protein